MRARLRAETRALHRRVERASPFLGGALDRCTYEQHLARRLGFRRAVEPALEGWLGSWGSAGAGAGGCPCESGGVPSAALLRADIAALQRDLFALGWTDARVSGARACPEPPSLPSFAHALGCTYVFEGARIGGRSIAPAVTAALGLGPDQAAGVEFLRGGPCGGMSMVQLRRRFAGTLGWIDGCAAELDVEGRDAIVEGARATFTALARWLEQPPTRRAEP